MPHIRLKLTLFVRALTVAAASLVCMLATLVDPTSAQSVPAGFGGAFDVAADGVTGLYVAGGNSATTYRVVHFAGISSVADRVYGRADAYKPGPGFSFYASDSIVEANGITVDSTGGLYVADSFLLRVLHFSGNSTVADRNYGNTASPNVQSLPAAQRMRPTGVAVDPSGGLYVASPSLNRVLHYPGTSTTPDRVYGQPNFSISPLVCSVRLA